MFKEFIKSLEKEKINIYKSFEEGIKVLKKGVIE
jgi:hypothetical protein